MRRAIEQGGRGHLAAVIEAIRSTGALDYAREQAGREAAAARAALSRLAHSSERNYLIQLADFAVTRSY
ncbi:Octaprenyl-diphosphate synthase [compost metagenome]